MTKEKIVFIQAKSKIMTHNEKVPESQAVRRLEEIKELWTRLCFAAYCGNMNKYNSLEAAASDNYLRVTTILY